MQAQHFLQQLVFGSHFKQPCLSQSSICSGSFSIETDHSFQTRDFFSTCVAAGRAFQGEVPPGVSLPTGDSLIKPVKKYVSDYLCLMLLGAGPRHLASCVAHLVKGASEGAVESFLDQRKGKERLELEEMVQALLEEKLANGSLNQARVAKASNLATKLGGAVAKWELFLQLDQVDSNILFLLVTLHFRRLKCCKQLSK